MKYQVKTTSRFDREFKKLDRYTHRILKSWIDKRLVGCENPRAFGKSLSNRDDQWRYRIGDCRIICIIEDAALIILALTVGHGREVYKK